MPSLLDQPHAEAKSRANKESLYSVGITPSKTEFKFVKWQKTKKIDCLHYFHPTLSINPIIQSPTPTRKAIN
jgi:hypothetical protein